MLGTLAASGEERPQPARNLPLSFEQNQGQAEKTFQYLLKYNGSEALFSADGVDFRLAGLSIHMRMMGANTAPEAVDPLQGRSNYLIGPDASKWIRGVPHFRRIDYQHLYPGISLAFYGNGDALEHDFQVEPGADPSQISFRFDGAEGVSISTGGDLNVRADEQTLTLRKPAAYQTIGSSRRAVDTGFVLRHDGAVGFRLGAYDRTRPLVIDPVFVFSSYLGGTGGDTPTGVTTDGSGNIYLTGSTTSADFPTANPLQPHQGGCDGGCLNAFITKLNPSGTALIYSTYLGGSEQDQGSSIAVDATGNVIVGGLASSPDFPHAGAIQSPSCQTNNKCYFLASLAPDGSSLNYSGKIGGADGVDSGVKDGQVALDTAGNAYLTGVTDDSNFQLTPGTLSSSEPGYPYSTLFVLKVGPTGKLLYSTVVPGNATQDPATSNNLFLPTAIAVDGSGQVTVAGTAALGLPTTSGVIAEQFPNALNVGNATAGFVLQLNSTASAINFASYLPGTDQVGGMAIDPKGDLYFAGRTFETTLPVGSTAYQKTPTVNSDGQISSGYVLQLSSGAKAALAATYLDGTASSLEESSSLAGVALDSHGDVFVGGSTGSADFPLVDPFTTILESGDTSDGMVIAELNPSLSSLLFGSFLSSMDPIFPGSDFAGLAIDYQDNLVVTGITYSRNFPTTAAGFEPQLPPAADPNATPFHSFIAKINLVTPASSACFSTFSVHFGSAPAGTSTTQTLQVKNCGNAPLNLLSITSSDPAVVPSENCGSIAAGSICPLTLTFTPVGNGSVLGTITITDNAVLPPPVVGFDGTGQAPQIQTVPTSAVFPEQVLGINASGAALTIVVQNFGEQPLTVNPAKTTATGDFSVTGDNCTSSIVPSQFCAIQVSFTPTQLGQRTGTLNIASNDPANPVLVVPLSGTAVATYPLATLSLVLQPSDPVTSGNTPVYATVQGSNFFPSSVVYVNGVAQTTTYQNSNSLAFTISPTQLKAMGEIPVTVVNPAPGGGSSASYPLVVYLSLPLQSSSLVVDPVGGLIYAAIPASAAQNPSTVIAINPSTGAMMPPVAVSSDPQHLAVSDDGSELYVATSAGVLQRLNLKTMAIEKTFSLPVDTNFGQTYAEEMHVVPGSPQSIVVELFANVDPDEDGAALYNDAGLVNWIPGAGGRDQLTLDAFTFVTPTMIYGLPEGSTFFAELQVNSTGLSVINPSGFECCTENTGSQVASDGTLLYTNSGEVWNPTTQTLLGTYLDPTRGSFLLDVGRPIPDTANGHTYFLENYAEFAEGQTVTIGVYDQVGFGLVSSVPITGVNIDSASDLVRWGSNGFAFRVLDTTGTNASEDQIVLLTTGKVTASSGAPLPIISSVSPSSLYLGGPAQTLQVNGGGFTSASTVLVNGNPRTTAFVNETSLTAQLLASDVATPVGQVNVQVTTPGPGGGTSNYATLSLGSQRPVITIAPSALNIDTSQTLTLGISVSAPTGYPTPTGTVALSSTIYSSAAATLKGGSGTIQLPPGSLELGIENLTVSYVPDAASAAMYDFTTATATVAVGASSKATPTLAVTLSSPSITTAQVLTVSATVSGASGNPTPTGNLTITFAGMLIGEPNLVNGSGSVPIASFALPVGNDTLLLSYLPDSASSSTYNGSIAVATVSVSAPPKTTPTVTVTPSASSITTAQALMVTVAVSGGSGNPTPTGAVRLSGGGFASTITPLSGGSASFPIAAGALAAGNDTLTASYVPDLTSSFTYGNSAGAATVVVSAPTKTTPTVMVTPSTPSITTAQALMVTVAVSGGSGTVTLSGGGFMSAATALSGGSVSIPIAAGALAVGSDTLTASYTPDSASSSTFNSSTGMATILVSTPIGTAVPVLNVTLSAASITNAQSVTINVTVTGASGQAPPTGIVSLSSGTYSAQSMLSGGAASDTAAAGALADGVDILAVSYAGDANYASANATATVTVSQVLIVAPAPTPVSPGSSANTTVTLSAGTNYAGTLNLKCALTASPAGAVSLPSCTLNPASVVLVSGGSGSSALTVHTTAASSSSLVRPLERFFSRFGGGAALAAVVLFVVPRKRRAVWMTALLLLAVASCSTGCGGGNSGGGPSNGPATPATTAGAYTFTVTATDSANANIADKEIVTVTVN